MRNDNNLHATHLVLFSGRYLTFTTVWRNDLNFNTTVLGFEMIYGYARVSTTEQDLTVQEDALKAAGCEVIRSEKVSGTSRNGRSELQNLLDFARDGDEIVVTRIDRLARSVRDLQNLVFEMNERGVSLRATEQSVDTRTSAGKCFLDMLSVFAEFETNLRRERQMEGIAKGEGAWCLSGSQADD